VILPRPGSAGAIVLAGGAIGGRFITLPL